MSLHALKPTQAKKERELGRLSFSTETAMVRAFCSYLANTGVPDHVYRVLEFDGGNGIADIVLFSRVSKTRAAQSLFSKVPPRLAYLLLVAKLPEEFSSSDFSSLSGMSKQSTTRLMGQLVRTGILRRLENGGYRKFRGVENPVQVIVSIEAKLRKWQQALRQALRYREYSHQSWVLLDSSAIDSAYRNLDRFVRAKIGLASIDATGRVSIAFEPPILPPLSDIRFWNACVLLERRRRQAKKGSVLRA